MSATGFLLAAGFGTRLRPLTHHRPKPLVPVCGVPMLDYALALLRRHGVQRAVVNAHHLAGQVRAWADAQDLPIHVSVEQPEILGTGGGLAFARDHLGERFVIVNGDILCDVDLGALLDGVDDDTDAVMALRRLEPGEGYGVVAADAGGRVVDLVGLATAAPEGPVDRSTHFTGVHALSRRVLELLPPEGASCVVRQGYVKMVPQRRVAARLHTGTWFDVGTPEAYLEANLLAVRGALRLPLDPFARAGIAVRDGRTWMDPEDTHGLAHVTIQGPAWIGPGARLEPGCRVGPGSVIGSNARIGAGAEVRDAVVWDGCEVEAGARIEGAVVHDGGVLQVRGTTGG